ncbi:MAG: NUDIX domain-containing protein [Hasllibacter sp.]
MAGAAFHGAKVALFLGDRLVVLRRDDDPAIPHPGMWDFPGGGREGDETPRRTAAREAMEEVGLDLSDAEWIHASEWRRDGTGDPVHFLVARLPEGPRPRLGDEGTDLRLMTVAEVMALPDLVPSLRERLGAWLDGRALRAPGAPHGGFTDG